ncbi:MAG: hypothetical protein HY790_00260 [Deltaproteobacteria bacterium]|nr:hypothetical protein [Deltaproteobacteria bacterium]MBI4794279.1 hypothetical protein [Deltaproteobacteria bacterium]
MKKFGLIFALLLMLALAGCAGGMEGQGTASPRPIPSSNYNWGADATCSPGCPPGMSGSW